MWSRVVMNRVPFVALWLGLTITAGAAAGDQAGFTDKIAQSQVTVLPSGFRRDLETGDLVQMLKITNRGNASIREPFHLVLRGLEAAAAPRSSALRARVRSAGALTIEIEPESPDGLKPGEHLTLLLRFDARHMGPLKYDPIVVPAT